MGDVKTVTWTVESDDKSEKNYALFVSGGGAKVQVSGWMDSPQDVVQGIADGLAMGAPGHEGPES
jgi:hypothetical protein